MSIKNCIACNRPIKGRTDKKFCNDSCRNNYNQRLNRCSILIVRNINNILRKNRGILERLLFGLEEKILVVERKKLVEKGFIFEYFTECYTNKESGECFYCYDYGYRIINSEKVQAVKDTRMKHFPKEKETGFC